ncbi:uncharacterized protein LOC144443378 [Glandiceps talaboti]
MFWRNLATGLSRIQPSLLSRLPGSQNLQQCKYFSSLPWLPRFTVFGNSSSIFGNLGHHPGASIQPCRTNIRGIEYQPNVRKRLKKHGWKTRVKTKGGIKCILRRKLKGRKLLTHLS